jgi:DNA-binding Lrp family transcriptional regulator
MSEHSLMALLRALKRRGVVRRVGAALDHRRAGYRHNALVVWNTTGVRLDRAAKYFASLDAVSHCYRRRPAAAWPYSLYTMVHGRCRKECLACIRRMARRTRIADHRVLTTVKEYKKTRTDITGGRRI